MNTPKIYDGMVLSQKLPATLSTFEDISDFLINKIVKGSCRVCFFVADYYLPNSIRSLERKSWPMTDLLWMKVSIRDHKRLQQFDKFSRFSENKTDLVRFLINDWSTNNLPAKLLENKELYVTVQETAFCISSKSNKLSMGLCNRLSSEQEEADTSVFMCKIHFWHWIGKSQHCNSRHRCGYFGSIFSVHAPWVDLPSLWNIISNDVVWTCLNIYWIEVLFKLCLVYMLLVAVTQLAASKEKVP